VSAESITGAVVLPNDDNTIGSGAQVVLNGGTLGIPDTDWFAACPRANSDGKRQPSPPARNYQLSGSGDL
jgi:hypothetical protein